jgi:hypothetical protein
VLIPTLYRRVGIVLHHLLMSQERLVLGKCSRVGVGGLLLCLLDEVRLLLGEEGLLLRRSQ